MGRSEHLSRIPYVHRRAGRYVFRRRIHFRKIISKLVTIALQTADPKLARERAAILSARFVNVKSSVGKMMECEVALSGDEIETLFRQELESELGAHVQRAFENGEWSSSALELAANDREMYRILRLPDRFTDGLVDVAEDMISDASIKQRLAAIGASVHSGNIAAARTHLIRARAAACSRVQRLFDDDILDSVDPVRALMADLRSPPEAASRLRQANQVNSVEPMTASQATVSQLSIYDDRRFGDVIDDVIAELKAEGVWKGDPGQQRRIM